MGKFLHSLPWTVALALAQAGDAGALPLPATAVEAVQALLSAEDDAASPGSIESAGTAADPDLRRGASAASS